MKGHMQDGKFHPHSEYKKGVRKSRDTNVKTQGVKITTRLKREEVLGKDFHIYRIWSTESDEGGGDRSEIAHVKAKNIDDAVEFVIKHFVDAKQRDDLDSDGDEQTIFLSKSFAFGDDGQELTQDEIDKIEEKGEEVSYSTAGFEISEDDEEEEDFKTIFGGNDYFDVTGDKVKTKGETSEEAIERLEGIQNALNVQLEKNTRTRFK